MSKSKKIVISVLALIGLFGVATVIVDRTNILDK